MDLKLELVTIPVTDVDRSKAFYGDQAGFNVRCRPAGRRAASLRAGHAAGLGVLDRALGTGLTTATPGPAQLQVVVDDVHAARADLLERGIDAGEVQGFPWGFVSDPDGNNWAVQQLPPRE
jgi:catechol 2,3-dioxygenase-like lactoylglutathione lyase family enzyme